MKTADILRQKLTAAFAPIHLDITDNSALHAGHAGHRPEGETHFAIVMVSEKFHGLTRVQRHQYVYKILASELNAGLHALELDLKTP